MPASSSARRQEVTLSVIAAFILLASFLVKDVLRERVKERIDSLQTALTLFDQGNEFDHVSAKLEDLRRTTAYASPFPPDSPQLLSNRYVDVHVIWETYYYKGLRFDGLITSAPESWRDSKSVAPLLDLIKDFKADNAVYSQLIDQFGRLLSPANPGERGSAADIAAKLDEVSKQGGKLFRDDQDLQRALPARARTDKASEERWYLGLTLLSYLLFVGGWVLALYGKIFHVPGLAAD